MLPPHERLRPVFSEDWARQMETAHDTYMEQLYDSVLVEEPRLTIDGTVFCGCDTCHRRASWLFLTVWIIEACHNGDVDIENAGHPDSGDRRSSNGLRLVQPPEPT
jgi:hypothetical protein